MFLLRAHRPALYRERPAWRRDGPYGGADDRRRDDRGREKLSTEEIDRRIAQLIARAGMKLVPLEDGDSTNPENLEKLPILPP